jgi:hypothetical protein
MAVARGVASIALAEWPLYARLADPTCGHSAAFQADYDQFTQDERHRHSTLLERCRRQFR